MFYLNTCSSQKLMFIHAWLCFCNRTTKEMVTFGIIYFMLLLSCDAEKSISSCDAEKFIYVSKNGSLNESCWDGGQAMPCATLDLAFDGAKRQNSTTVVIENGNFSLNHSHAFQDLHDLKIVGDPSAMTYCHAGAGLAFISSSNISISNVTYVRCGASQTSTSKNFVNNEFIQFNVALYFLLCETVSLSNVNITNSSGTGMSMYATGGRVDIENCEFSFNAQEKYSKVGGGGGLYIEFVYCIPNDTSCAVNDIMSNVPSKYSSNSVYNIRYCLFHSNNARVNDQTNNTFIIPQKSEHLAFGRGGGLSLFIKGNATNNTIDIEHCRFTNNIALWGAGLFSDWYDNASYNNLSIHNSIFLHNECYYDSSEDVGTGGGGVRIGYFFFGDGHVKNSHVVFHSCLFAHNRAYWGAGLSFYAAREQKVTSATNTLQFHHCVWDSNNAHLGSAVDLSLWHSITQGVPVWPHFHSCNFTSNINPDELGNAVGVGAVYLDSVPVAFYGTNYFVNNQNSALVSDSVGIYVQNHSKMYFDSNKGRNGGAISLLGHGFIETGNESELSFVNNNAIYDGGAIYSKSVGQHDIISSRRCFIRFYDGAVRPENWTSKFYFKNNTVGNNKPSPSAIFATTLLPCVWGGAHGAINLNKDDVFCWSDHWNYGENCSYEIATAPTSYVNYEKGHSTYFLETCPGNMTDIPFSMVDDRNKTVTSSAVLTVRSLDDEVHLQNDFEYISDGKVKVLGTPNSNDAKFVLETIAPRVVYTEMIVSLNPCPLGMQLNSTSGTCYCSNALMFNGLISCFESNFSTSIRKGGWIGVINASNVSNTTVAAECPYCSSIDKDQLSHLEGDICSSINRSGVLCGDCIEGFGPAVFTSPIQCCNCSANPQYRWALYFFTDFFLVTVFFLLLVILNVSITSGPANSYVFFAQVISTGFNGYEILPSSYTFWKVLQDISVIVYDIWNLNFFRPLLPAYCLNESLNSLQLLSLGYVTALVPIFLILLLYFVIALYDKGFKPVFFVCRPIVTCFAKVRRTWNVKRSVIHAFASFLVLSYTKFAVVSFLLLQPKPLVNHDGKSVGLVVYYYGSMEYFSSHHAPYVAISLLVLLTFVAVPPIILIYPTILRLVVKCTNSPMLERISPGRRMQHFLDVMQSCYRDGTNNRTVDAQEVLDQHSNGTEVSLRNSCDLSDYRWFSGLYFIFRIVFLCVTVMSPNWFAQFILQQFLCIASVLCFTIFRPYKNNAYNNLDCVMFSILSCINAVNAYSYYLVVIEESVSLDILVLKYFLMFCPFAYMTCYVTYQIWKSRRRVFEFFIQCHKERPIVRDILDDNSSNNSNF